MKSKTKPLTPYERAKKKVERIKGFYKHLIVYILVNIALLLVRESVTVNILGPEILGDPDFLNWINWNVFGTPIIWGIGLLFHGLSVYSHVSLLGSNWEARQIEKYMKEDEDKMNRYNS